ncbi:MAG: reductive dehalogenase [Chloroflexi bacterium]|nr:reductive dehalogenase [Chloroflexota bacterium]
MSHQVNRPTYEIVGPLSRFDERDSVFARERLRPGSPQERAYHALRPELTEIDRRLARFIEQVDEPEGDADQLNSALYRGSFGPVAALALPDIVDGPVAERRLQVAPDVAARRLKAMARHLGADEVRIGPLNPAWVYSHRGTPPFFDHYRPNPPHFDGLPAGYNGLRWGDPIELPHTTAISMAFAQDRALLRSSGTPFSDFEVGRVYAHSALVATQLAAYIRALGWSARAHHMRHYDVLVVPVAVDSGLGELGRCGYLINKRLGANLRLVCVTTDMPLALDRPVDLGVQDFCRKCLKCATTCPVRAIPQGEPVVVRGVRKWKLDEVKCLLYWGHLGAACAICQTICPWSKPPTLPHRLVAEIAVRLPAARRFLVWADDLVYGREFRPAPPPRWGCETSE